MLIHGQDNLSRLTPLRIFRKLTHNTRTLGKPELDAEQLKTPNPAQRTIPHKPITPRRYRRRRRLNPLVNRLPINLNEIRIVLVNKPTTISSKRNNPTPRFRKQERRVHPRTLHILRRHTRMPITKPHQKPMQHPRKITSRNSLTKPLLDHSNLTFQINTLEIKIRKLLPQSLAETINVFIRLIARHILRDNLGYRSSIGIMKYRSTVRLSHRYITQLHTLIVRHPHDTKIHQPIRRMPHQPHRFYKILTKPFPHHPRPAPITKLENFSNLHAIDCDRLVPHTPNENFRFIIHPSNPLKGTRFLICFLSTCDRTNPYSHHHHHDQPFVHYKNLKNHFDKSLNHDHA